MPVSEYLQFICSRQSGFQKVQTRDSEYDLFLIHFIAITMIALSKTGYSIWGIELCREKDTTFLFDVSSVMNFHPKATPEVGLQLLSKSDVLLDSALHPLD